MTAAKTTLVIWHQLMWHAQSMMFGLCNLSKAQRLILGIFVLLLVDVIWVVSTECTRGEICLKLLLHLS